MKSARWTSCELKVPARRTVIRSPTCSHSSTEPGPIPSLRRTSAGTEICPCAVSRDLASGTPFNYHGNACRAPGLRAEAKLSATTSPCFANASRLAGSSRLESRWMSKVRHQRRRHRADARAVRANTGVCPLPTPSVRVRSKPQRRTPRRTPRRYRSSRPAAQQGSWLGALRETSVNVTRADVGSPWVSVAPVQDLTIFVVALYEAPSSFVS